MERHRNDSREKQGSLESLKGWQRAARQRAAWEERVESVWV